MSLFQDLNRNGKIDLGARFNIKKFVKEDGSIRYLVRDNASLVLTNENDDKNISHPFYIFTYCIWRKCRTLVSEGFYFNGVR